MIRNSHYLVAVLVAGLAGCSTFRPTNVTGTWSCPLINGVCQEIAEVDGMTGPIKLSPQSAKTVPGGHNPDVKDVSDMPDKTRDVVGRIVFAPTMDADGNLHDSRAVYSVMEKGTWRRPPPKPKAKKADEEASLRLERSGSDQQVAARFPMSVQLRPRLTLMGANLGADVRRPGDSGTVVVPIPTAPLDKETGHDA